MVCLYWRDALMELGDFFGEGIDVGVGQLAPRLNFGHELGSREFAHLHQIFDGLTLAADDWGFEGAGYRQYLQTERRRHALLQEQFLLAEIFARSQFGTLEAAEIPGLFHLRVIGARKNDP